MSAVFVLCAALSLVIGVVRPGVILALSFFGYIYESYFGGQAVIGIAFAMLPIPYMLLWCLTRKTLRFHPFDAVMLIFTMCYVAAAVISPNISAAFLQLVKFFAFATAPWFLTRCFIRDENDLNKLVKDLAISVVILSVLFGFVSEPNEWGFFYTIGSAHPVGWSLYLNASLCFLFAYLFLRNEWRVVPGAIPDKIFAIVAFILVAYFAYLNGKRGSTFSPLIAFVIVITYLNLMKSSVRSRVLLVTSLMLAVVSLPILMQAIVDLLTSIPDSALRGDFKVPFYVVAQFFGATDVPTVLDESSAERRWLYFNTWDMILKNPLFGNGVFSFQERGLGYAHSIFIETWLEGGIPFLLAAIALIGTILWTGFKALSLPGGRLAVALTLTATLGALLQMLTALTIAEAKMFWLGCAILMAARILQTERRPLTAIEPVNAAAAAPAALGSR